MTVPTTKDELSHEYYVFLKNLPSSDKLKIVSDLTASILDEEQNMKSREQEFQSAFNSFDAETTAEELIENLRQSRYFDHDKKLAL